MCKMACVCGCGQEACACAPAPHSAALATTKPLQEVDRCTECGGAASLVEVTTPAGKVLRAQFCRRCDRATAGARRMRGDR